MTHEQIKSILAQHLLWLKGNGGACADLTCADLTCADLTCADLMGADLRGAVLRGAVLTGADLRGADLTDAVLRGADLTDADLTGAVLGGADLRGADLTDAVLRGADLTDADLTGAVLGGAVTYEQIPIIPDLDKQILTRIEQGGKLDMRDWHICETTHCRAGWAVTIAPGALELEKSLGTPFLASLLYAKAYPSLPVPDFYATDEEAMADMRERAAL